MGEMLIKMWGLKILTTDPASMEVLAYRTEGEALEAADSLRKGWVRANAQRRFDLLRVLARVAGLSGLSPEDPDRRAMFQGVLGEWDPLLCEELLWTGVDSDGAAVTVDLTKVSKWCVELVTRKAVGVAAPAAAH